jgi:hypothetical protein
MARRESVFSDDWRDCLRAHYTQVVKNNDQVTLSTLVDVLNKVGFEEAELHDLYVQATMRAEDVDFVPDPEIIEKVFAAVKAPEPEAVAPVMVEAVPDPVEAEEEPPADEEEPPPPAVPGIQQLSLF